MPAKPKRGRPVLQKAKRRRRMIGLRLGDEVRARIETEAQAAGRSLSQEIEARIERSFDRGGLLRELLRTAYGDQSAGVLMLLSDALRRATASAEFLGDDQWPHGRLQNSFTFGVAEKAAFVIFRKLAAGATKSQAATSLLESKMKEMGWPDPGERIADQVLKAAGSNAAVRELLGPLAEVLP